MKKLLTISLLLITVVAHGQLSYTPKIDLNGYYDAPMIDMSDYFDDCPTYKNTGRQTFWQRNKKGFAITGIQLLSVVLDATGDAVYDMGKESGNSSQMTWGHTLQASAIGVGMLMIPMIDWERPICDGVKMAVSYLAMRYAVFDLAYNLTRGIDPLYADGIKGEVPPHGRAWSQAVVLTFSIALNFKEF